MKPLTEKDHDYITKWVRNGGILLYYSEDKDPFQTIKEWWNSNDNKYLTPSAHLFKNLELAILIALVLKRQAKGMY